MEQIFDVSNFLFFFLVSYNHYRNISKYINFPKNLLYRDSLISIQLYLYFFLFVFSIRTTNRC